MPTTTFSIVIKIFSPKQWIIYLPEIIGCGHGSQEKNVCNPWCGQKHFKSKNLKLIKLLQYTNAGNYLVKDFGTPAAHPPSSKMYL